MFGERLKEIRIKKRFKTIGFSQRSRNNANNYKYV